MRNVSPTNAYRRFLLGTHLFPHLHRPVHMEYRRLYLYANTSEICTVWSLEVMWPLCLDTERAICALRFSSSWCYLLTIGAIFSAYSVAVVNCIESYFHEAQCFYCLFVCLFVCFCITEFNFAHLPYSFASEVFSVPFVEILSF